MLEPGRGSNDVPNGSDQADQLVRQCVASAREVAARGVLLRVTFETLFEYMTVQPRAGLGARQCSLDAGQRTVSLHPLSLQLYQCCAQGVMHTMVGMALGGQGAQKQRTPNTRMACMCACAIGCSSVCLLPQYMTGKCTQRWAHPYHCQSKLGGRNVAEKLACNSHLHAA